MRTHASLRACERAMPSLTALLVFTESLTEPGTQLGWPAYRGGPSISASYAGSRDVNSGLDVCADYLMSLLAEVVPHLRGCLSLPCRLERPPTN